MYRRALSLVVGSWPRLGHKTRHSSCIIGGRKGIRATESAGLMRFTANSIPTAPTTENIGQGSGFGEDALVVAFVGGDDVVGAVVFSWR
jgi:hypothetical protein